MKTKIDTQASAMVTGGVLYETDGVNRGTEFPYGELVKYPLDEHRRGYSHEDAIAVAEMVNASSWITRERG